jgi:hypothetical protein
MPSEAVATEPNDGPDWTVVLIHYSSPAVAPVPSVTIMRGSDVREHRRAKVGVAGVEKRHQSPTGEGESLVHGVKEALVGFAQYSRGGSVGVEPILGAIRGPSVDDDVLEVDACLAAD